MKSDIPKQLLKLGGITILERTLTPFVECPEIGGIVVVAAANVIELIEEALSGVLQRHRNISVVRGGERRQDSIWNGLHAVPGETDIVLIHDAVRPFIRKELITRCVKSTAEYGAVTVVRPLTETVKEVSNGVVTNTLDRSSLRITQTPQAFRTALILEAHRKAREDGFTGTDDCVLVERLGHPVHVVEGDDYNMKITTPADLKIAGAVLPIFESEEKQC